MPNIEDYEAMTKISLSEDEKTIVSGYMNMLLDSFKKLEDTDVSGVVPLISVLDVKVLCGTTLPSRPYRGRAPVKRP